MIVKAIETQYKGYRFRSRLEARWAVFFDYCDYKWEYEPEGYNLGGISYLPDFKVKRLFTDIPSIWLEVKPDDGLTGKQQDDANDKMMKLVSASDIPGVLVFGAPWDCVFCLYKIDIIASKLHDQHISRIPGLFQNYYNKTEKEAAEMAKAARFEHGEHGQ
jgi:hypothetical protein